MKIWGEVRVRHGHAVAPVGMDRPGDDVGEVSEYWATHGVQGLHATDVDGALGHGRNWAYLEGAARTHLPLRFGGGIRHMAQVEQLLALGVRQAVVGTQGIDHPAWLRELALVFPDRILAGLDLQQGRVVVDGRRRIADVRWAQWAQDLTEAGVAGIVYTELDEGHAGTPDLATVHALAGLASAAGLASSVTVTAGNATPDLIDALRDAGASGAILPPEAPREAWDPAANH